MKYELTDETMTTDDGVTFRRIRALKAFSGVQQGDLGGWIETEDNLSHEGDAWIFGNAKVYGYAQVFGDAEVFGNAKVFGDAEVFDSAWVYGDAKVFDSAWVYCDAKVFDSAWVYGDAKVYGNAKVYGYAQVFGDAEVYGNAEVHDDAKVYGDAWVYGNAKVYGDARVYGNANVFGDAEVYDNAKVLGDTLLTRFLSANRSDGFTFTLLPMADGSLRVSAGCRFFSFEEARNHWTLTRGGTPLGDETMMILDYLERAASVFK